MSRAIVIQGSMIYSSRSALPVLAFPFHSPSQRSNRNRRLAEDTAALARTQSHGCVRTALVKGVSHWTECVCIYVFFLNLIHECTWEPLFMCFFRWIVSNKQYFILFLSDFFFFSGTQSPFVKFCFTKYFVDVTIIIYNKHIYLNCVEIIDWVRCMYLLFYTTRRSRKEQ